MQHGNVREVRHAGHGLQEPEPLNRSVLKNNVQQSAQTQVGSFDDDGRFHAFRVAISGLLALPHCRIIQRQLLQLVPNLQKTNE